MGRGIGFGFSWRMTEQARVLGRKVGYCGIYPQTDRLQWPMIHQQQMKLLKDSDEVSWQGSSIG